MDIRTFALGLLSSSPMLVNNPQAQRYIQVISSNDSARGREIAGNLCATYGVPTDQAVQQAKQFFGIPS